MCKINRVLWMHRKHTLCANNLLRKGGTMLLVEMNYQRFFDVYKHIFLICRAVEQKNWAAPHAGYSTFVRVWP